MSHASVYLWQKFLPYYPHGGGRIMESHFCTRTPKLNQYFETSCHKGLNCIKIYLKQIYILKFLCYTFSLSGTFFNISLKLKKLWQIWVIYCLFSFKCCLISIYTVWYKSIPLVVHICKNIYLARNRFLSTGESYHFLGYPDTTERLQN